jgi:hypothetical protein
VAVESGWVGLERMGGMRLDYWNGSIRFAKAGKAGNPIINKK